MTRARRKRVVVIDQGRWRGISLNQERGDQCSPQPMDGCCGQHGKQFHAWPGHVMDHCQSE